VDDATYTGYERMAGSPDGRPAKPEVAWELRWSLGTWPLG